MKRGKRLIASLLALLFALTILTPALAADVPKPVMNARQSVVRIVGSTARKAWKGSGFAVSENPEYIVTNHHVVDGATELRVYYDTDKYILGEVLFADEVTDLAVIKLSKALKDTPGISLAADEVKSGISVYALGFPGAADNMVDGLLSDKDSVTVTDGIVSAFREVYLVASDSTNVVQTNAAISGGNSGGPLVNNKGQVVGINSFEMVDAQNINGAIHVKELRKLLIANDVPFREMDLVISPWLVTSIAVGAVVLVAVVLILILRKRKKMKKALGVPLTTYTGEVFSPLDSAKAVAGLLDELIHTPDPMNHLFFLAPGNIFVSKEEKKMTMKAKKYQQKMGFMPIYPGYTAPEVYTGMRDEGSVTYSLGAILYRISQGMTPPEPQSRELNPTLYFPNPSELDDLISGTLQLDRGTRESSVMSLKTELSELIKKLEANPPATASVTPVASVPVTPVAVAAEPSLGAQGLEQNTPTVNEPWTPQERDDGITASAPTPVTPVQPYTPAQNTEQNYGQEQQSFAPTTPGAPGTAPYQTGYGQNNGTPYSGSTVQKKKRKKWPIIVAIVAVILVLAGGFGGYSYYQYDSFQKNFADGNYDEASAALSRAPWIGGFLDENANGYIEAQKLFKNGELEAARDKFEELGDFEDSQDLYEKLDTYLLAKEETDPYDKYYYFSELGDFLDSASLAEEALGEVYDEGVRLFEAGNLTDADDYFSLADSRGEAENYLYIIDTVLYDTKWDHAAMAEATKNISIAHLLTDIDSFSSFINNSNWMDSTTGALRIDDEYVYGLETPDGRITWTNSSGKVDGIYVDGTKYYTFHYIDYDTIEFRPVSSGSTLNFIRE